MAGRKSQKKMKEKAAVRQQSAPPPATQEDSPVEGPGPAVSDGETPPETGGFTTPRTHAFPGGLNLPPEAPAGGAGAFPGLAPDVDGDQTVFPGGASWLSAPDESIAFPGGNNSPPGTEQLGEAFPGGLNPAQPEQAFATPTDLRPSQSIESPPAPANATVIAESSREKKKSTDARKGTRKKKRQ